MLLLEQGTAHGFLRRPKLYWNCFHMANIFLKAFNYYAALSNNRSRNAIGLVPPPPQGKLVKYVRNVFSFSILHLKTWWSTLIAICGLNPCLEWLNPTIYGGVQSLSSILTWRSWGTILTQVAAIRKEGGAGILLFPQAGYALWQLAQSVNKEPPTLASIFKTPKGDAVFQKWFKFILAQTALLQSWSCCMGKYTPNAR